MTPGGGTGPTVSVVVPTLDRPEKAAAVVGAVLGGTETPLEVVVVDQSAGGGTEQALAKLGDERVRRIAHAPPSSSGARNAGAAAACGDYVAFLDDDVEVGPRWLLCLLAECRRLGLPDALFGRVRAPEGFAPGRDRLPVSIFEPEGSGVWRTVVHPNRVGYASNFACRRQVFLDEGGFDTRLGPGSEFPGAEDMDLAYRLMRAGYRVASTSAFEVVHEQWREPGDLPDLYYGYNVGGAAFVAKHLRAGDPRSVLFLLEQLGGDARMAASALRRRSAVRARVAAARSAGTWSGLVRGLRRLDDASAPGPGTSRGSPPSGGS
jgi:GT2 family glycosyltransferase